MNIYVHLYIINTIWNYMMICIYGVLHVEYKDGDEEDIILSNERINFFLSPEEMRHLNLSHGISNSNTDKLDINEMVVLAASLDNCHELDPGEIIWAKLSGHATWPAIVLDESVIGGRKGLNKIAGEMSILVQFFGTHDFDRVRMEQAIPFLKGLLSSCHLKCKKSGFVRSLDEAKMYLSTQKLPKRMLRSRKSNNTDNGCANGEEDGSTDSDNEVTRDTELKRTLERIQNCPFEIEDLQVQSFSTVRTFQNCISLEILMLAYNHQLICCLLCSELFLKPVQYLLKCFGVH